ncbi:putative receptor-like protein kinase [Panicum miliaceum]|uniref:Receptor-like protein kinase n=1 Tax=Panicum miliaceum TaxID=4540 RepID=A0A3L6R2E0_PANMI|nr:putative receptor-like protein kinase [Panicum miliaceum]
MREPLHRLPVLARRHASAECGYKAFQVICDSQGNVPPANSFWRNQILDIFYPSNSFRAINIDLMFNDTCDLDTFFNASSDLGLSPFSISSKNQELFFLYSCDLGRRRVPPSWTRVVCSTPVFALLGKEYAPGGTGMPPPMNCSVSMIPVLGYEGATGADYQRLLKGGSLLEYTDAGACKACTDTGGQCRTSVADDVFECHCYDGVHSATCDA